MALLLLSGTGANRGAILEAGRAYLFCRSLSYTTFAYRNLRLPGQMRFGIKVKVTVEIEKAGKSLRRRRRAASLLNRNHNPARRRFY